MTECRPAESQAGSNFEGKRTPDPALDHEQGEQAEPNKSDQNYMVRDAAVAIPRELISKERCNRVIADGNASG